MTDITWRKARGCAANGTCVEAGAWRKACNGATACIEACCATGGAFALLRDSTDPDGPRIALTTPQWSGLLTTLKELP